MPKKKPTVVVVTGGFDPLHSGHIEYFKSAKALGDILVVGVNSDQWLKRKKGRPFMDSAERANIVKHLAMVDDVVPFGADDDADDTATAAIYYAMNTYPDHKIVFANGGDRGKDNIPEMDAVSDVSRVEFAFGVGGDNKMNSSSWILQQWDTPETVRQWGSYRELYDGKGYKVKELVVEPGKSLSDQYHLHRSEHWIVLEGIGHLKQGATRNMEAREFFVQEGESVFLRRAQTHKLTNPGQTPLRIVEVWAGDYLNEDDIIRLDVDENYGK